MGMLGLRSTKRSRLVVVSTATLAPGIHWTGWSAVIGTYVVVTSLLLIVDARVDFYIIF